MPHSERLLSHSAVSTALALLSDERLAGVVAAARPLGAGIGGRSAVLEIEGRPVFVKRVPLTDRERLPANVMSTANLFGLPPFCQYGIGGPGFGVWREVAVHTMTTNWVLAGECPAFPLTYHWRVLPEPSPYLPDELADVDRAVEYWDGSPAVRERIEAIAGARASVALFMEYFPVNLHDWLTARVAEGGDAAGAAYAMVERELRDGVAFMNARGLLHFDAHFENVLTDGEHLYFADFGLATSARFTLSAAEAGFRREHLGYDRAYTLTHLVNWLLAAHGHGRAERTAILAGCAAGAAPGGLPDPVAAIVARHAPLAVVMNDFFRRLRGERRTTPYPAGASERLLGREAGEPTPEAV